MDSRRAIGYKKTVNRIKGKLNITSEIDPSDVFIEFESDKPEDILSINYWSSNANEANNIIAGTFFNIEGDTSTQNAVAVNLSQGGKSYIGSHQKLKNFQSSLFF